MTTGALFTIGYEGRTQAEYLARLTGAGVTLLADVRRNPISRKKGFSKSTLAQGCTSVTDPRRWLATREKWLRERAASARFRGLTSRERANARTPAEDRGARS